jgi:hypothetical protein
MAVDAVDFVPAETTLTIMPPAEKKTVAPLKALEKHG